MTTSSRQKVRLGAPERPERTPFLRASSGPGDDAVAEVSPPTTSPQEGAPSRTGTPARVRSRVAGGPRTPAAHALAAAPAPAPAGTYACEGPEELLARWRLLPDAERRRCLALMSLDLQAPSDADRRDVDLWSEAVYEALGAALGPSDGGGHGPQVVRRLLGAPGAWGPVAEVLEAAGLAAQKPAERYSVMRLLARLLVMRSLRVARNADVPLTAKLVANNAQHLAGIVDNAFPGYLASGLLPAAARAMSRKGSPAV